MGQALSVNTDIKRGHVEDLLIISSRLNVAENKIVNTIIRHAVEKAMALDVTPITPEQFDQLDAVWEKYCGPNATPTQPDQLEFPGAEPLAEDQWETVTEFLVFGEPRPGGSKQGFVIPGTNRVSIVDANKNVKYWRSEVANAAKMEFDGPALGGTFKFEVTFYLVRPKSHYGTGCNVDRLKANAPPRPNKKPDLTKLVRSTEDALTGIVWIDDAAITDQTFKKRYVSRRHRPGAIIRVERQIIPGAAKEKPLFGEQRE